MKCTKCQGEWTPPANKSLGKCPFCQADILQMLNEQAEVLSTEVILANMLQAYGTDLLQNQQRLSAMISDLFAHDHKTKRLLLLSVREGVPAKLILLADDNNRNTHIVAIQQHLAEDAFLKNEIAEEIVNLWTKALGYSFEEPDDSFQIVSNGMFYGFQNIKGEMITPYKYVNVYNFKEGLAGAKFDGRWGYIDKRGKEIIPFIFDEVMPFSEELASVRLKNTWGFIDKKGEKCTQFIYNEVKSISNGLAGVKMNTKWGFINKIGKEIISFSYDEIKPFKENIAQVCLNGIWNYIDKSGNEIYDRLRRNDKLTFVELNGKWGVVDETNKVVLPLIYSFIHLFKEGIALAVLDGKRGFIDRTGKQITPLIYEDAFDFTNGLAPVKLNSKWGYIDCTGNQITPFIYDRAGRSIDGFFPVELNGESYYLDKTGKVSSHKSKINSLFNNLNVKVLKK